MNIIFRSSIFVSFLTLSFALPALAEPAKPHIVQFSSGSLTLGGELYLPEGAGPFPVVLFNHGSAPHMDNSIASAAIGPQFAKNGWAFFMPYRRGQGLSEKQGAYIMDEINSARWTGWGKAEKKLVELLRTDHLNDQMAALSWLQQQTFVSKNRIATVGNSFGGIQVVLGMERGVYCAGVDAAGASESWADSEDLQALMKRTVKNTSRPIFFFQAKNDYNLAPTYELSSEMEKSGKIAQLKIYPAFGSSAKEGHSFPYRAVSIWFNDALSFINKYCAP